MRMGRKSRYGFSRFQGRWKHRRWIKYLIWLSSTFFLIFLAIIFYNLFLFWFPKFLGISLWTESGEKSRIVRGTGDDVEPRNVRGKDPLETNVLAVPDHETTKFHEGPGEMGKPVFIDKESLSDEERKIFDAGFKRNSFNQYASDMISVKRSLPDMRSTECAKKKYPKDLPDTSIIICFHNEAWSTLLRSVHSILDRTPSHLLKEIILVDDASELPHLKSQLDEYFAKYRKVQIIRSTERIGLIKGRLLGYKAATGTTLTFLDSHIECTKGWLEPLLARISEKRETVVWPIIDVINLNTLAYKSDHVNTLNVGGFDWGLQFTWHRVPERDNRTRKSSADPIRSPTMAGGLFAIDRSYFEHLGTYDPDFDIWGGENLELSFKTWMCGGSVEMHPCSRVGHIFRDVSPYKWRTGKDALKKNLVRLAEVWLDDYKKYYFERINDKLGDYGDVSERKALRKRLNCKSFAWYLKNIYPDAFIPDQALAWGEIRNQASGEAHCIDTLDDGGDNPRDKNAIGVWPCHGMGGNQYWSYTNKSEIRHDDKCLDFSGRRTRTLKCHGERGNQGWLHDASTGLIKHIPSKKCLQMDIEKMNIVVEICDENVPEQKWKFAHYPNGKSFTTKKKISSVEKDEEVLS